LTAYGPTAGCIILVTPIADWELKKFNTSDSAGVLFLKLAGIKSAIITGENSLAVKKRFRKLEMDDLFMGVKNKVDAAEKLLQKYNLEWKEVAYIGDDLNDILLLRKAGLSACPSSAKDYIKKEADWVLKSKGGEGAFREFVEKYFHRKRMLNALIEKYLQQLNGEK